MKVLTPSGNEAALFDGMPGVGHMSRESVRDLLRDTALLVTTLASGGQVEDAAGFRDRCRELIERFSDALERRGYADDVREEALIAQCGLLDETALRHLPAPIRDGWERKPLQVERFNLHDAGERVFDRLEARMREPSPRVDLLECYHAILAMGLVGRYAREGEAKRTALAASLTAQLDRLHSRTERPFNADRAGRRFSDWLYRLSPWAIVGLACVAATAIWIPWAIALDVQLAHLVQAKGIEP